MSLQIDFSLYVSAVQQLCYGPQQTVAAAWCASPIGVKVGVYHAKYNVDSAPHMNLFAKLCRAAVS